MNKIQALIGGIALVAAGAASAQADWHTVPRRAVSSNTLRQHYVPLEWGQ